MNELFAAFGVDWKLLAAQGVNFGIVLVALWYFLYRPVMTTLEKRRTLVAKGVEDAQRAGEKLARADAAAAARGAAAEGGAGGIGAEARSAGSGEKAAIVEEARAGAASLEQDARARAA